MRVWSCSIPRIIVKSCFCVAKGHHQARQLRPGGDSHDDVFNCDWHMSGVVCWLVWVLLPAQVTCIATNSDGATTTSDPVTSNSNGNLLVGLAPGGGTSGAAGPVDVQCTVLPLTSDLMSVSCLSLPQLQLLPVPGVAAPSVNACASECYVNR